MKDDELLTVSRESAVRIALSFYAGEPCRICGIDLTMDDLENGAVFAGSPDANPGLPYDGRAAHKECWDKWNAQ